MYTDPSGYCYTGQSIFDGIVTKSYWDTFWDAPFLGPCSSTTQPGATTPISTCTPTFIPDPTATLTPTIDPNSLLSSDDDRAEAFLIAVKTHSSDLQNINFSMGLFLAMGMTETGPYSHWNNEGDGIMQLEDYNQKTLPYGNTLQGINNNVKDAISLLTVYIGTNSLYSVFSEAEFDKIKYLPYDDNNLSYYRQCKAVLMYNGGYDPISVYNSNLGNPNYVGDVADTLDYYVPSTFGIEYRDDNLVLDLRTFQEIFNSFLD